MVPVIKIFYLSKNKYNKRRAEKAIRAPKIVMHGSYNQGEGDNMRLPLKGKLSAKLTDEV